MPKLKEPSRLEILARETIGKYVLNIGEKAVCDISSGRTAEVNITSLHQLIHGGLPPMLSCEMTTLMFKVIRKISEKMKISERTLDSIGGPQIKRVMKKIILGKFVPCPKILDLSILPEYAQNILTEKMHKFRHQTMNAIPVLSTDSIELVPIRSNVLNFLVKFKMRETCTDAIIETLTICSSQTIQNIDVKLSENVTNASFNLLPKCHKLKRLSISGTSMTVEGFVKYLQIVQQYKHSDDTLQEILHISVGSAFTWEISTTQLNEIAIACPKLRKIEIANLIGDMETLVSLNELVRLKIGSCQPDRCNLHGFLKVRGNNLTSLQLTTEDPISLISIMNHCRNLKKISLLECNILDTKLEHITFLAEAFKSLEILKLTCSSYSLPWIEHILETCVNLRHLCFHLFDNYDLDYDDDEFKDDLFIRLLSKNALCKLTMFKATNVNLSMKTVDALIDNCPLLKTLGKLDQWHDIEEIELNIFKQKIKDDNQDLRII